MKKNVLLMVPMLDQGGVERMCALTAMLLKDACLVTVLVFNGENRIYDLADVELIDLHLGSKQGKLNKAITVMQRVRQVQKIKKSKQIAVTYSFGNTANLVNVLSKGTDQIYIGIRGYGALLETKLMAFICKRADKVICCTNVMEEELRSRFKTKEVITLYNPCDIEQIRREAKEPILEHTEFFQGDGKIIATMGRMHDVKGYWHLIKIFHLVQQKMPDTKLLFIGDKDSGEYQRMVSQYGLEKKVLFLGVQSNPFRYLHYASAYLLTSLSEGFPNALIEAMALRIPVLAANCKTGPAEILLEHYKEAQQSDAIREGEYGILLPTMNAAKNLEITILEPEEKMVSEKLVQLFQSKELQEKYQNAGEKRAESFSIERYRETLLMEMMGGNQRDGKKQ